MLIKQYKLENKEHYQEYKKKYTLENKELIANQNKIYRLKNVEKIVTRALQKFDCECGGKYNYSTKSAHLKTLKHLKYCKSIINV